MSEGVDPTAGVPASTATNQPAAAPKSTEGNYTSDTKVSTLKDLKEVAPKLVESMMQGIAMNIVSRMRKSQARLKKMMRQSRR